MKKYISLILLMVLVLTLFAGCGSKQSENSSSDTKETTKLVVWAATPLVPTYKSVLATNPKDTKALLTKKIITQFETENPGVKVQLVFKDWADKLNENLMKALKSNEYMDIVPGEQYIKAYMGQGFFSEFDLGEYKDKITPMAISLGMMEGKVYAVPIFTGGFGLIVNKAVLKDAGIIDANEKATQKYASKGINPLAPTYWEDLLEICQDIKTFYIQKGKSGKGGMLIDNVSGGNSWRALNFMRTAGGEFLDEKGNFVINSEENIKAFTLMRNLEKTSPKNSIQSIAEIALFNYLYDNNAAYIVEQMEPFVNSGGRPAEGKLVLAELPTYKPAGGITYKKSNVLCGTVYYSIMKNSKNKELAAKFIKLMLKDEYQKEYIKTDYRVPVIKDVLNSSDIKTAEYHYNEMISMYKPFTDESYNFKGAIPSFEKNTGLIWEEWDSFLKKVFSTSNDIKTLADDSNKSLNAIKDRQ